MDTNFLIWILSITLFAMLILLQIMYFERVHLKKDIKKTRDELEKFKEYYFLLVQWGYDWQINARLSNFLYRHNYKTIAIYGAAEIGELLYEQMKKENVEVMYYIDRRSDILMSEIPVYSLEDKLPDVDVVVVTAIHYYDEIRKILEKKHIKSVNLKDVVCGV